MNLSNYLRHLRITLKTFCYSVIQWILGHRELVVYVFFGALTTFVDWGISFGLYALDVNVHLANIVAWTAAVLFAFITNRNLVFHSKRRGLGAVIGELIGFSGGRILSLAVQELLFVLAVDVLSWNEYLVKIPVAVLVVIINYFISKFLFRDSVREKTPKPTEADAPAVKIRGRSIMISNEASEPKEENDREAEL